MGKCFNLTTMHTAQSEKHSLKQHVNSLKQQRLNIWLKDFGSWWMNVLNENQEQNMTWTNTRLENKITPVFRVLNLWIIQFLWTRFEMKFYLIVLINGFYWFHAKMTSKAKIRAFWLNLRSPRPFASIHRAKYHRNT